MMLTVDGGVFQTLLPNMVPGKVYQVTVSAVKGLEESDPSTDTVTTGRLSLFLMLGDAAVTSQKTELKPELNAVFLFVPSRSGQTSGSDCGQRHRHLRPADVAAVCGHRGRLRHHLQRGVRCLEIYLLTVQTPFFTDTQNINTQTIF